MQKRMEKKMNSKHQQQCLLLLTNISLIFGFSISASSTERTEVQYRDYVDRIKAECNALGRKAIKDGGERIAYTKLVSMYSESKGTYKEKQKTTGAKWKCGEFRGDPASLTRSSEEEDNDTEFCDVANRYKTSDKDGCMNAKTMIKATEKRDLAVNQGAALVTQASAMYNAFQTDGNAKSAYEAQKNTLLTSGAQSMAQALNSAYSYTQMQKAEEEARESANRLEAMRKKYFKVEKAAINHGAKLDSGRSAAFAFRKKIGNYNNTDRMEAHIKQDLKFADNNSKARDAAGPMKAASAKRFKLANDQAQAEEAMVGKFKKGLGDEMQSDAKGFENFDEYQAKSRSAIRQSKAMAERAKQRKQAAMVMGAGQAIAAAMSFGQAAQLRDLSVDLGPIEEPELPPIQLPTPGRREFVEPRDTSGAAVGDDVDSFTDEELAFDGSTNRRPPSTIDFDPSKLRNGGSKFRTTSGASGGGGGGFGGGGRLPNNNAAKKPQRNFKVGVGTYGSSGGGVGIPYYEGGGGEVSDMQDAVKSLLGNMQGQQAVGESEVGFEGSDLPQAESRELASIGAIERSTTIFEIMKLKIHEMRNQGRI